jgi:probable phosphoglycerate mutase
MACLFLLRHAQPVSDGVKRFVGQTDLPLSEQGRRQAAWWRGRLRRVAFCRIVASDLIRARETAEIIAAGTRQRVEPVPGLREIHLGSWENKPLAEIRDSFHDQWRARGEDLAGFRPPGGESFNDLQGRVVPIVNGIMAAAAGDVLAVAHAGVNRVLLCTVLGIPLARLFNIDQDPVALNIVDFEVSRTRVRVINLTPDVLAQTGWADACPTDMPH